MNEINSINQKPVFEIQQTAETFQFSNNKFNQSSITTAPSGYKGCFGWITSFFGTIWNALVSLVTCRWYRKTPEIDQQPTNQPVASLIKIEIPATKFFTSFKKYNSFVDKGLELQEKLKKGLINGSESEWELINYKKSVSNLNSFIAETQKIKNNFVLDAVIEKNHQQKIEALNLTPTKLKDQNIAEKTTKLIKLKEHMESLFDSINEGFADLNITPIQLRNMKDLMFADGKFRMAYYELSVLLNPSTTK